MTERVEKTLAFLNQTFDVSDYWKSKQESRRYRYDHSIRVAKFGAEIAENENLDREAVVIACLLHDCSYGLDFDIKKSFTWEKPCPELENMDHLKKIANHGYISALHSVKFLESIGYSGKQLEDIVFAIARHTEIPENAQITGEDSLFVKTIRDADEIDHVHPFRFYEDLLKFNFPNSTREERLNFYWSTKGYTLYHMEGMYLDLRTETAKRLYKEGIDFRLNFLEGLKKNIDESFEEGL